MSRYLKPKREKRKRPSRPDKTTLWNVSLKYIDGSYNIVVSRHYTGGAFPIKIRTIGAKAAGRKYARENLAWAIASMDLETTNMMSPEYMDMDPEYLKKIKQEKPRYSIVVEK